MWRFVLPAAAIIAGMVLLLSASLNSWMPLGNSPAPSERTASTPPPVRQPAPAPVTGQADQPAPAVAPPSVEVSPGVGPATAPERGPQNAEVAPQSRPDATAPAPAPTPAPTPTEKQADGVAAQATQPRNEAAPDPQQVEAARKQDAEIAARLAELRGQGGSARRRTGNELSFASVEALLGRLRRDQVADATTASGTPTSPGTPTAPPAASPSERLGAARQAVVAGSLDQARSLLQAARVQLAFQPNTPDQPEPAQSPGGGEAAREIAQALGNLDAGRPMYALRRIDRALASLSEGPFAPASAPVASPGPFAGYATWPYGGTYHP